HDARRMHAPATRALVALRKNTRGLTHDVSVLEDSSCNAGTVALSDFPWAQRSRKPRWARFGVPLLHHVWHCGARDLRSFAEIIEHQNRDAQRGLDLRMARRTAEPRSGEAMDMRKAVPPRDRFATIDVGRVELAFQCRPQQRDRQASFPDSG